MAPREVAAVRVKLTQREIDAVTRVLESGDLAGGPEVAAFEQEFSQTLLDGRPCVAVNSGTSALHLGLLACGLGPEDEVIVPSFTFAATANAVAMTGATPVFADIDPETYCLDPADVASKVRQRTKAILAVHLYGHPADWDGLTDVAEQHGLLLLEDAAQAHGASYGDRPIGTLGTWAAFSFYATKNMTTGEGGLVACANEDTARRVRLLRNQGMERRYANEAVGLNNRLTDVAASLGRVQLTTLEERNARRRQVAERYTAGLRQVVSPSVRPGDTHAFHQFTVRVTRRDEVLHEVRRAGIHAAVYYPTPVHRLPAYSTSDTLPITEAAAAECMSLPIHPLLTDEDVDFVIDSVNHAVLTCRGQP
jgi:perosamine synthetase